MREKRSWIKQKKPNGKRQARNLIFEPSIYYKDEAELLDVAADPDKTYIEKVLPRKMQYNLREIRAFGF